MKMRPATGTRASRRSSESGAAGSGRRVAFWVAGATLVLFNAAVSAPSPLYAIYQAKLGFSATILTVIFAVYVVAVLVAVPGRQRGCASPRGAGPAGHFGRGDPRSAQRPVGRSAAARQRARPAGGERRATAGAGR